VCAICHAAETGEPLSEELQDDLLGNVRLGSGFMVPKDSVILAAEDIPDDPMMGKNADTGSSKYWVRVVTAFKFAIKELIAPTRVDKATKEPMSKVIAREKKSKRVFRIEDKDAKFIDLTTGDFKE